MESVRITKLIGDGRFGNVYRGHFGSDEVVVEQVNQQQWKSKENEILLHETLHHENIIQLLHVEVREKFRYLVFELYYRSLTSCVSGRNKRSLPPARDSVIQLIHGLDYIHSRFLVHRNINPDNVLVCPHMNGSCSLKISGFSHSAHVSSDRTFLSSRRVNDEWSAPECLHGLDYAWNWTIQGSLAVDIFSMGCVLFFLLTKGLHPFGSSKLFLRSNKRLRNILDGNHNLEGLHNQEFLVLISDMIHPDANHRPPASDILQQLTGQRKTRETTATESPTLRRSEEKDIVAMDTFIYYRNRRMGTGPGRMGYVYKGRHQGQDVVVKKIPLVQQGRQRNPLEGFDINSQAMKYILQYSTETDGDFRYVVMDQCCGNLNDYIRGTIQQSGAENLFLQDMTAALVFIHDYEIHHGNIKPENILLSYSTAEKRLVSKISDIALWKWTGPREMRLNPAEDRFCWTAPEVLREQMESGMVDIERQGSMAMDVFSMGCVFHYLLTRGQHPFQGKDHISTLENILLGCSNITGQSFLGLFPVLSMNNLWIFS